MKIYTIKQTQVLPIPIQEAWDFFSTPKNLLKITPEHMRFRILHMTGGEKTYAGQLITYQVGVLPGYSTTWVTEIMHVNEPHRFIDDQRFGPFALWQHQHNFKAVHDGTEMTDEVTYAVPLGLLGRFAHWLFVRHQVNRIFKYRSTVLENIFPKKS